MNTNTETARRGFLRTLPAVAAATPDLESLIADHQKACAAYFRALDAEQEAEAILAANPNGSPDAYEAASAKLDGASGAEAAAAFAVCAYSCATIEDVRRKAGYIATVRTVTDFWDENALAFIKSLTDSAA